MESTIENTVTDEQINDIAERIQASVNRLATASGNMLLLKAARALGRTDIQYIKTDVQNVEIYATMSVKPDSEGLYTVIRNGKLITVKANQGMEGDILPVSFSFEIYGETTTNMQGNVNRKVSKTTIRKFIAYLQGDSIVMARYNMKESLWEKAQLPNSINRADFTESDLGLIVAEKLISFYNRLNNGNEPLKHRTETRNGENTLYGQYKAQ